METQFGKVAENHRKDVTSYDCLVLGNIEKWKMETASYAQMIAPCHGPKAGSLQGSASVQRKGPSTGLGTRFFSYSFLLGSQFSHL